MSLTGGNIGIFLKFLSYHPQRSCGKVIFSRASVILSTGGACVAVGKHAWQGACIVGGRVWQGVYMAEGMHGRVHTGVACMAAAVCGREGMCGRGMHGSGHVWKGACLLGACMALGMHSRGTCMAGGIHGRGHAWQGAYIGACLAGGAW